jgi:cell division initiation protein
MIDLTPLDVRKKRGDFAKGMRGYERKEVDHFLELVAERLEELVKENLTLKERVERLGAQVDGQEGREKAVQDALVTAQELRKEIKEQAHREAEMIRWEARADAERIHSEVERVIQERRKDLVELDKARARFLKGFRTLLERQLDGLEVEEASSPEIGFDLDAIREAVSRREQEKKAGKGGEEDDPVPLDSLLADEEGGTEPDEQEGKKEGGEEDDLFSPSGEEHDEPDLKEAR